MKKIISSLILILIIASLSGNKGKDSDLTYNKINASDAREMINEDSDIIILDVRTEEEYNSGHIEGAVLLPNNEIEEKAEELLRDKSANILVYCRSGNRSASASQDLIKLGYTNVYDFGGILDWPYDIVTE